MELFDIYKEYFKAIYNITEEQFKILIKNSNLTIDQLQEPHIVQGPQYCFPSLEEMGYKKVVHCKDCKYRPERRYNVDEYDIVPPKIDGIVSYKCPFISGKLHGTRPGDNFYCALGEKK